MLNAEWEEPIKTVFDGLLNNDWIGALKIFFYEIAKGIMDHFVLALICFLLGILSLILGSILVKGKIGESKVSHILKKIVKKMRENMFYLMMF